MQCTKSEGARALASPVRYLEFWGTARAVQSRRCSVRPAESCRRSRRLKWASVRCPLRGFTLLLASIAVGVASWLLVYGAKGGGVGVCRRRRCKVSRRRLKIELSLMIARVSDSGSVLLGVLVVRFDLS